MRARSSCCGSREQEIGRTNVGTYESEIMIAVWLLLWIGSSRFACNSAPDPSGIQPIYNIIHHGSGKCKRQTFLLAVFAPILHTAPARRALQVAPRYS